jgi:hypothetical protein
MGISKEDLEKEKYTEDNFRKIHDKISEICDLCAYGNLTAKGIRAILMLLKNNMYSFMEVDKELELKPYWYLNSFGSAYRKKKD